MIDKRWFLPHLMPMWWFFVIMTCVGLIAGAAAVLVLA